MITKTHFGSEIDVLEVGKDYSTCLFTKTGITNTVDNHDIQWPEDQELPENDVGKMAEKITEIFNDGKKKKLCSNNKIDNILNSKRVIWLEKAYTIINNRLFNSLCPSMITISWSFPTKTVKKILGQTINSMVENENNYMIVINPTIADTLTVLQVLTHEMIHVHVGNEQLHGKEFTKFAKSIGFNKPYTKLPPSTKLDNELVKVIDKLGNIPSGHVELSDNKKKQSTRNFLWECDCGTKVRCAIKLNATCNDCNTLFIIQE